MLRIPDIRSNIKKVNPMRSNRVQASVAAKEVHKQNIQKSLEHRLEVAKSKGDEKLIGQLEAEMAYHN